MASGASRERWRTRGVRVGFPSAGGGSSDVLEALRDGGPTKRAGAGRRLDTVFVIFSEDMAGDARPHAWAGTMLCVRPDHGPCPRRRDERAASRVAALARTADKIRSLSPQAPRHAPSGLRPQPRLSCRADAGANFASSTPRQSIVAARTPVFHFHTVSAARDGPHASSRQLGRPDRWRRVV